VIGAETRRHRMRTVRLFFRPDALAQNSVIAGDIATRQP